MTEKMIEVSTDEYIELLRSAELLRRIELLRNEVSTDEYIELLRSAELLRRIELLRNAELLTRLDCGGVDSVHSVTRGPALETVFIAIAEEVAAKVRETQFSVSK